MLPGLEKGATATDTIRNATEPRPGRPIYTPIRRRAWARRRRDSFAEIGETIGRAFLPIMDEVLPALLPILKAFGELITALLPVLIPLVQLLAGALRIVAGVLSAVVGFLVETGQVDRRAIGAVSDFLGRQPVSGFSLPRYRSSAVTQPRATAARSGRHPRRRRR